MWNNRCHFLILIETPVAFPNMYIITFVKDNWVYSPKTEFKTTYLEKRNIDEKIYQKVGKRDEYENEMHKLYNSIVSQTNEQLQKKFTHQAIKSGRDPIRYLKILKNLYFSNQLE